MKYKVGDRVKIKSLDWYNENKDEYGNIDINHDFTFYADRSKYCGKVFTIDVVFDNCYTVKEDNHEYYWADEMIEGLVEEETKPKYEDEVNGEYYSTPKYLVRPSGYQFVDENGNVINVQKIVLEKKRVIYPKTYEECCEILEDVADCSLSCFACGLLNNLQKLLLCRDAYWKIAGDKMGLGRPWEPDWEDDHQYKYTIYTMGNKVIRNVGGYIHSILAFPTEKIREAFYENFKEEIEKCKELL